MGIDDHVAFDIGFGADRGGGEVMESQIGYLYLDIYI